MLLDINYQIKILLTSVLAGILIGILFDLYRNIVKDNSPKKFLLLIEDTLFWILISLVIFTFLQRLGCAFIGVYIFLYIFIGAVIYYIIFRNIFMKVENIFIYYISFILRIVYKTIWYHIKVIFLKIKLKKNLKK